MCLKGVIPDDSDVDASPIPNRLLAAPGRFYPSWGGADIRCGRIYRGLSDFMPSRAATLPHRGYPCASRDDFGCDGLGGRSRLAARNRRSDDPKAKAAGREIAARNRGDRHKGTAISGITGRCVASRSAPARQHPPPVRASVPIVQRSSVSANLPSANVDALGTWETL